MSMARGSRCRFAGWLFALLIGASQEGLGQTPPRLWVMGEQISFGTPVTITLSSDATGQPALLALGLTPLPLDAPLLTGKGPLYFGQLLMALPFGVIPASGRIDVPVLMPASDPLLLGMHVVLQGFVAGTLTNPATIPLVEPYYEPANAVVITSPIPQQSAHFGDQVAVGDLNGDGHDDLAVGAWFETVAGQLAAGRVYVLWGPDFTGFVQLTPPAPAFAATFGGAVLVEDLDGDGIDDLLVSESTGSPEAGKKGHFYLFHGAAQLPTTATLVLESLGSGEEFIVFGRTAAIGDLDADGFLDLVAGIPSADFGSIDKAGRADVYFGPGYTEHATIRSALPGPNDYFGSFVAIADVNGDGIADLVEGSGRTDVGGVVNVGRVEVIYGPSLVARTVVECPLPDGFNTRFGDALDVVDLEGDGAWDILTRDDRDHAYVLRAPALTEHILITRPTDAGEATLPSPSFVIYTTIGDINSDGITDFIVSDPHLGPLTGCGLGSKGGWVYAALGPYWSTFDRRHDLQPKCNTDFGWSLELVSSPGMLDGHLLIGNRAGDVAGLPASGHIVVLEQ
jgi:hypothetical protein